MVKISSEEFDSHSDEIAYLAKIHGGRLKEWTDYEVLNVEPGVDVTGFIDKNGG